MALRKCRAPVSAANSRPDPRSGAKCSKVVDTGPESDYWVAMNSVQMLLNQKFLEMKAKNPRLSHRFFAQKLGLSSGALSEILKGKRKISHKLATKLAARLHLDPVDTAAFVGTSLMHDPADIAYLQVRDDQFHLISEWPHFAILNLVKSDLCLHRPTWFAQQLNLPLKTTQNAIDRLLRLGMLVYEKKKYVRTSAHLQTSDDILNLSIQKSNVEDLERVRELLGQLPVTERDLTSLTMLLDPKKMPEFKRWIRKAQDQFAAKFETTQSISPFRLTVSLFPLKNSKT
jgi:transcriptional regulator with XRE-family HTH domain